MWLSFFPSNEKELCGNAWKTNLPNLSDTVCQNPGSASSTELGHKPDQVLNTRSRSAGSSLACFQTRTMRGKPHLTHTLAKTTSADTEVFSRDVLGQIICLVYSSRRLDFCSRLTCGLRQAQMPQAMVSLFMRMCFPAWVCLLLTPCSSVSPGPVSVAVTCSQGWSG